MIQNLQNKRLHIRSKLEAHNKSSDRYQIVSENIFRLHDNWWSLRKQFLKNKKKVSQQTSFPAGINLAIGQFWR